MSYLSRADYVLLTSVSRTRDFYTVFEQWIQGFPMAAPCLLLHYCEQILEPYFRSLIKWYVVFCCINPLRLICNVDVVGC
jgi:hypothetical protein